MQNIISFFKKILLVFELFIRNTPGSLGEIAFRRSDCLRPSDEIFCRLTNDAGRINPGHKRFFQHHLRFKSGRGVRNFAEPKNFFRCRRNFAFGLRDFFLRQNKKIGQGIKIRRDKFTERRDGKFNRQDSKRTRHGLFALRLVAGVQHRGRCNSYRNVRYRLCSAFELGGKRLQ